MSVVVACPKCHTKLQVADNARGKISKCPACAAVFIFKSPVAGTPAPAPVKSELPKRSPVKAGRKADGERPRKTAARKGREEEDDGRERAAGKTRKKKSGCGPVVVVLGVVGLVLLLACVAGAHWTWQGANSFAGQMTGAVALMATDKEKAKPDSDRGPAETAPKGHGTEPDPVKPSGGETPKDDGGETKPAAKVIPTRDLDLVPRDSFGFLACRVSDFWNDKNRAPLRQAMQDNPVFAPVLEQVKQDTGLTLADIDRIVTFIPTLKPSPQVMMTITTNRPLDRDKIAKKALAGWKEKQAGGKTIFFLEHALFAVHFADDRTILLGEPGGLEALLKAPKKADGPLDDALREAADAKAPTVLGALSTAALPADLKKQLAPAAEPFLPLLDARKVTLTLQVNKDELPLALLMTFDNEKAAQEGEKAARTALELLRDNFPDLTAEARGPDEVIPGSLLAQALPVAKDVETGLREAKLTREGTSVRGTLRVRTQLAGLIDLAGVMANPEAATAPGAASLQKFPAKEREAITALSALRFHVELNPTKEVGQSLGLFASNVELTPEALQHLQQLTSLESLNLYDTKIEAGALARLKGLANLRDLSIDVHGPEASGAWVKDIRELPNIRHLRLACSKLSDPLLAELGGMKNLEDLILSDAGGVMDVGMKALKDLPKLRSLKIRAEKVTPAGLATLGGLRSLTFRSFATSLTGWEELRGLKNLEELSLGAPGCEAVLKMVKDLPNLKSLGLKGVQASDENLKTLQGLDHLQELTLGGKGYTGAGLRGLKGLRTLEVSGADLTDAGLLEALSTLKDLEKLSIFGKLTGECLQGVRDSVKLQELSVWSDNFKDSWLQQIAGLKGLRKVSLTGKGITDAGVKALKDLPDLRTLSLSFSNVTDAALKDIQEMKVLEKVTSYSNQTTPDGVARLKKARPNLKIVTYGTTGIEF
jgi:internalin A